MRRRVSPSLLLVMMFLSIGVTGCSSPVEKAYSLSSMYKTAQDEAILARKQKLITDAQWDVIADADAVATPLVQEALRSANRAEVENIPWNKTYDFNVAFDSARKAVRTFLLRWTESKPGQ